MIVCNRLRGFRFEVVKDEARMHPRHEITLPSRKTEGAMAYDIYAPETVAVAKGSTVMIWTDVKVKIPTGYALLINIRSGDGARGWRIRNTQGWIDSDYYNNPSNDGNIGICLENAFDTSVDSVIKQGERIAQAMLVPYFITEDDNATSKRQGGFGSTGR